MRAPAAFDSVVMAAIVADLRAWMGSRVRRITQPTAREVALDLHGRASRTLLMSVDARWARIHLSEPVGTGDLSPFGQMLRARLTGARLVAAEQPPFERTVSLRFDTDGGPADLVVEIMARHSNLVLVQDGLIAGALKLIGRDRSAVREILPGRPLVPPPRNRPAPAEVDTDRLRRLLEGSDAPLAQALTSGLLGISPVMGREVAVRAGLDPDRPASSSAREAIALHRVLRDLVDLVLEEAFHPLVYLMDGAPAGYAPFPLEHLRSLPSAPVPTMSEAVAHVTGRISQAAELEAQRRAVAAVIGTALAKLERTQGELERSLTEAHGSHTLRAQGELLLAYASQIPAGSREATLPGFDGTPVTMTLDPTLTPVENARKLFDRYTKLRAARPQLEARLRAVQEERRYLEAALAMADLAGATDDVAELRRELAEEGYLRGHRVRPTPAPKPRTFVLDGGAQVLVGRSNRDNDRVTFKAAGPDDLWFHARGVPGAHVVLRTGGRAATEEEIAAAASAAAYFSRAQGAAYAAVDYTARRYVRKPRGSRPGSVTYERERTVQVVPRIPTL